MNYYYCKNCNAAIKYSTEIKKSICEYTNKIVTLQKLEKEEYETLKLLRKFMKL